MDVQRVLARIGLAEAPRPDLDGLRAVHRAFLGAVPYEALAVQLGESGPLDPAALEARVLQGGRGGYCFEVNTVLLELLRALGFAVQRRLAIVAGRDAEARGEPVNHMALVVTIDGQEHLADSGIGEGPVDPVALVPGATTGGPMPWTVEREGGRWYVAAHEWASLPGFGFGDAPARLEDFAEHHRRLSTQEESSFVQVLVVQRPFADRIVTLRARTLSVDGPAGRTKELLPDLPAFAAALREEFGIDPGALGEERMARLWQRACEQHARWAERRAG
jgi:N-hydroxyarylamine O-acetyltransferase